MTSETLRERLMALLDEADRGQRRVEKNELRALLAETGDDEALARAWDEGYDAAYSWAHAVINRLGYLERGRDDHDDNPYRAARSVAGEEE